MRSRFPVLSKSFKSTATISIPSNLSFPTFWHRKQASPRADNLKRDAERLAAFLLIAFDILNPQRFFTNVADYAVIHPRRKNGAETGLLNDGRDTPGETIYTITSNGHLRPFRS
jgi:hypothetical protein